MNKIDKAQLLDTIEQLRRLIEKVDPEPSSCSYCLHCINQDNGRCNIPDPSKPIPPEVYPVGCSKWQWDGIPF